MKTYICRAVGYWVSLPPDCKNSITLVTKIPIQRPNWSPIRILVNPQFVSDSCFFLFHVDMVEVASFPLVDPLGLSAIIPCFHLYSKVCMRLKRKWESSYHANKPALFIYKCKFALLSQLIGNWLINRFYSPKWFFWSWLGLYKNYSWHSNIPPS